MASDRWSHIDSIRGFAALAVVYYHVAEMVHWKGLASSRLESGIFAALVDYTDLGKIAVVLFFAVSGFVIPFSLLKPQQAPLRSFAISRLLRLYPAYWLSILIAVPVFASLRQETFTPQAIAVNITMLQQFVGQPNIMGVYWTLQIEIVFYILCAGMFFLKLLHRPGFVAGASLLMLAAALGMAAVRYSLAIKLPVALPLALCIMFWGVSWRYAVAGWDGRKDARLVIPLTVCIGLFIPVISLLAYNRDMGFGETWYRYTISYCSAMGLFMLLTTRLRITHPIAVKLGTISYSVYLLGPIAQAIVEALLPYQAGYPAHLTIALTMGLTICFAWLCYTAIEEPFQRLGKRIAGHRAPMPEAI